MKFFVPDYKVHYNPGLQVRWVQNYTAKRKQLARHIVVTLKEKYNV